MEDKYLVLNTIYKKLKKQHVLLFQYISFNLIMSALYIPTSYTNPDSDINRIMLKGLLLSIRSEKHRQSILLNSDTIWRSLLTVEDHEPYFFLVRIMRYLLVRDIQPPADWLDDLLQSMDNAGDHWSQNFYYELIKIFSDKGKKCPKLMKFEKYLMVNTFIE